MLDIISPKKVLRYGGKRAHYFIFSEKVRKTFMCYVGPIPLKSVYEGQNGVGGMTNGRLLIENKSIGRRQ